MAMLRSDERRVFSPFWTLCVLALVASACGSDSTPADRGDDSEETSSAKGDDEDDESAKDEDDDSDVVIDAGMGGKKDAALDAKTTTPSMMKDARVVTATDSGGGDTVEQPDSGKSAPDAATIPKREDLGKGDGKDVITIGDSWMSFIFTGIQESLVKVSGQPYRTYGVPGTKLLDDVIPNQYVAARRANPNIKTVVMTGGGNDILQTGLVDDCAQGTPACQEVLDKIGDRLVSLWTQMSKDGVTDVIHIQYSRDAGEGTKNADANDKKLQEACASVPPPIRCHLLPSDQFVMGELMGDDIHPTGPACDRIAKGVLDLMVKEGMRR